MARAEASPALCALVAVRVLVGAPLLLMPGATLQALSRTTPDESARRFAQVLGARYLLEAAAAWRFPSVRVVRAGALIDALHLLTTLGLIARAPRRRLAWINTGSAGGFTLAGLAVIRSDDA